MTEEQIRDGYERLDSSLRAPQDAFDRVEKRMGARRRRRRIGVAAGTAVVVAAVGGYTAVSMGGSDDGRDGVVAVDPPPAPLVMTRPDGSTFEFNGPDDQLRPARRDGRIRPAPVTRATSTSRARSSSTASG